MLIFDLETDGLLDDVSTIHCLHIWDTEQPELGVQRYNDHNYNAAGDIEEGIFVLGNARELLAHNGIAFDYLVLDKLHPDWDNWGNPDRLDSIVMTSVIYPELKSTDFACREAGYWRILGDENPCPEKMGGIIGSHSLAAWGHRLGEHKGDFDPRKHFEEEVTVSHAWKHVGWQPEMDDYCVQDVVVTEKLWRLINSKNYSQTCLDLEHQFKTIIDRQERFGFLVDKKKADRLHEKLMIRKLELEESLRAVFRPWYSADGKSNLSAEYGSEGEITNSHELVAGYRKPKTKNGPRGEVADAPFIKVRHNTFNPASTDQIGQRLQKVFGWKPELYGKDGKPTCDDDVLSTLKYDCIPAIREYLVVNKRLGMLAEGKQAILRKIHDDGRIHGRVSTNGAVTGRCTHSQPNVAQTPRVGTPYGGEFRELYTVPPGWRLVGADASGLELRVLGHYLAAHDGGAYAKEVVEGDVHWANLRAIGVADCDRDPANKQHKEARDAGKTWVYSYIYGGGVPLSGINFALAYDAFHGKQPTGTITGNGRKSRAALKRNLPALAHLEKAVKAKAKYSKSLRGLDGRSIPCRSAHSALNALLQSGGALIMKKSLCILDDKLRASNLIPGVHYEFVANVHDEWQVQVKDDDRMLPDLVSALSCDAMTAAGEFFNLRCKIEGEASIGNNWKETH